mmetsp:Transcript_60833/g.171423  ORF Transcript_60833/g.171423 Transcript_60833/m.171423 type:complete len:439 (+) Transcript_60833:191-1507(+)
MNPNVPGEIGEVSLAAQICEKSQSNSSRNTGKYWRNAPFPPSRWRSHSHTAFSPSSSGSGTEVPAPSGRRSLRSGPALLPASRLSSTWAEETSMLWCGSASAASWHDFTLRSLGAESPWGDGGCWTWSMLLTLLWRMACVRPRSKLLPLLWPDLDLRLFSWRLCLPYDLDRRLGGGACCRRLPLAPALRLWCRRGGERRPFAALLSMCFLSFRDRDRDRAFLVAGSAGRVSRMTFLTRSYTSSSTVLTSPRTALTFSCVVELVANRFEFLMISSMWRVGIISRACSTSFGSSWLRTNSRIIFAISRVCPLFSILALIMACSLLAGSSGFLSHLSGLVAGAPAAASGPAAPGPTRGGTTTPWFAGGAPLPPAAAWHALAPSSAFSRAIRARTARSAAPCSLPCFAPFCRTSIPAVSPITLSIRPGDSSRSSFSVAGDSL